MIPENDTELCMDGYDRIEALEKVVEAADALAKAAQEYRDAPHMRALDYEALQALNKALAAYEKIRGFK